MTSSSNQGSHVHEQYRPVTSPKSRLVAILLVGFLGGLGVHRFYAGKTGTGILMLLLTCTIIGALISGPWAFIDLIMIATGSFRDGQGRLISEWENNMEQR